MNEMSKAEKYPETILRDAEENGWSTDLSYEFAEWADNEMVNGLNAMDPESLKVRERIYHGVKLRLEALEPYKSDFKASFKYMKRPHNAPALKKITWQTSDALWWAAGDTSTDYNHYTKRILLSGVFATTTLYWLRDTSDGYKDTWRFLERRINNVLKIGGFIGKLVKGRKRA